MGRARKFPRPRYLFAVGTTQEQAAANLDLLQDMAEETETRPGRKLRIDHYGIAITVADALPPEPKSTREPRKWRGTLSEDRIGAKRVTTEGGIELAGFDQDETDEPKLAKADIRAAETLQHALAQRGERVSLPNAVKIVQRTRALLVKRR
jgi:hypothetical protein